MEQQIEEMIVTIRVKHGHYSDWNGFNSEILPEYEVVSLYGFTPADNGFTEVSFRVRRRSE